MEKNSTFHGCEETSEQSGASLFGLLCERTRGAGSALHIEGFHLRFPRCRPKMYLLLGWVPQVWEANRVPGSDVSSRRDVPRSQHLRGLETLPMDTEGQLTDTRGTLFLKYRVNKSDYLFH